MFRTIFAQPDPDQMATTWEQVRDQMAGRFPKVGPLMDDAKAEVLAFNAFPRAHWRKIWSTNPLERLNREIKRRSQVVGILPNEAAVIRASSVRSWPTAPRMATWAEHDSEKANTGLTPRARLSSSPNHHLEAPPSGS